MNEDMAERGVPRVVWVFALVAGGYSLARWGPVLESPAWWALGAVCAFGGVLSRRLACRLVLSLAVVLTACAWFTHRVVEGEARAQWWRDLDGMPVRVRADAVEAPVIRDRPAGVLGPFADSRTAAWTVSLLEIQDGTEWRPARGHVRVVVADAGLTPETLPQAGERMEVRGVARAIERPLNPGEPNRPWLAAQAGELGAIRLESRTLIEVLESPRDVVSRAMAGWRNVRGVAARRARNALLGEDSPDGGTDEGRALLAALILGEEGPELTALRGLFARFGIVHVLSISGFHLVVMGFVALLAIRATGDRGGWEPVILAMAVLSYLAILPVNAPIWRSGLTLLALVAGDAAGRRYHHLAILAWVAIALLVWRPMDLFSPGFQLSFLLTAALRELMPRAAWAWGRERVVGDVPTRRRGVGRRLASGVWRRGVRLSGASALCWLVALPISVYHIGFVSVAGILTNVLLVPVIAVLVGVGYVALAMGLISPALGEASSIVSIGLARAIVWAAHGLDAPLGVVVRVPSVSIAWTLATTACVWWAFWTGAWRERLVGGGLAGLLALWVLIETWLAPPLGRHVLVRLDTLAVGDGTCHVLRSGRDAVVWDCGSLREGVGRVLVPRAVRAVGVRRVSTAIVTHPNLDHFNALVDAAVPLGLERVFTCSRFLEAASARPTGPEAFVLERLGGLGIEVGTLREGDSVVVGGATIDILSPPAGAPWREANDHSLVGLLRHSDTRRSILLVGDVQDEAIGRLRGVHASVRPDVIEAPHHGSFRDSAVDWVRELAPGLVIQSTGPRRAGDTRWESVRARSEWLATCSDGAAWVELRAGQQVHAGAYRRGPVALEVARTKQ